jgi:hypothetical protein
VVTADFSAAPQQRHRAYPRDRTHRHVVGYIVAGAPATVASLEEAVYTYAATYQLGEVMAVYRDRDTGPDSPREGFGWCVKALRTGRAHAVIVPHRDDLAPDQLGRTTLLATVRSAGGVVHIIDRQEETPS